MLIFSIITIFPKMFECILNFGIISKAIEKKKIKINLLNPRDYSNNKYKKIDDKIYGGGPGMLMMFLPIFLAIKKAKESTPKTKSTVIYLSPQGKVLKNKYIKNFLKKKHLIIICGRYEGIDERIIQDQVEEEWSIGDYILTGGELPAMVLIDAVSRFIPGVINQSLSLENESFSTGLLDYPQYTRPKIIKKLKVPSILLSGNHKEIQQWKIKNALGNTWIKKPDLIQKKKLTKKEKTLLKDFKRNYFSIKKK